MSTSPDTFRAFEHIGWSKADVCHSYHANFGEVTLKKQSADAMPRIREKIWQTLAAFKHGDRYEIPMPAVLTSAKKP